MFDRTEIVELFTDFLTSLTDLSESKSETN